MTDDLLARLERILELPDEHQEAAVDRECAGDQALRDELQRLLELGRSPRLGFLDRPVLRSAPDPTTELQSGGWIDRYRLVKRIGEGADGVVFEAEQFHPHRHVAVKVLRFAATGPRGIARFRLEGEALARLRHPGIAEVFEAGEFDGPIGPQPYLALELVGGRPLDDAARDRSRRERLDLFLQVCDAVAHCHANGVVHRDLKPGNALVDADGRVRLIDFGIARPSEDAAWSIVLPTATGLEGTLAYMSPEQASSHGGRRGDARGDVYSLGVMIYELLTGQRPFAIDELPLVEALRVIREVTPPSLSRFDRSLRGDLETIVGKAMARSPEERYRTAGELADDLRRYLYNEPIRARAPTRLYVFTRFARRNRTWLAAATFVLIASLAGTATSLSFAAEAREQAGLATQRNDESQRRLLLAQRSLTLLFDDVLEELPQLLGTSRLLEKALAEVTEHATRLAAELPESLAERRRLWLTFERLAQVRLRADAAPSEVRAAAERFHAMVLQATAEAHPQLDLTHDLFRAEWLASITGHPERLPFAMAAARTLTERVDAPVVTLLDVADALMTTQHGTGSPEFDRAQELVTRALTAQPDDERGRLMQSELDEHAANRWMSRGRPELALPLLEQAHATYLQAWHRQPANPRSIENLAMTLRRLADARLACGDRAAARATYVEARRHASQLVELDPDRHRTRSTLAWILACMAECSTTPGERAALLNESLDEFGRTPNLGPHASIAAAAACNATGLALQEGGAPSRTALEGHWRRLIDRGLDATTIGDAIGRIPLGAAAKELATRMCALAGERQATPADTPIDPVLVARSLGLKRFDLR